METSNGGGKIADLFKELNESQKEAVKNVNKPLLVFAGPGTGKTRVTTTKVAYLISELNLKPEEVLALTFTTKAAEEMKERVEELLPGKPGIRISTFHSFCNEIIGENFLELGVNAGKTVIRDPYQQTFLLSALNDLGLEKIEVPRDPTDLAKTFQGTIARFKQENISIERLEKFLEEKAESDEERIPYLRDLAKAYRAYEEFKLDKGLIDYGDMQLLALKLFEKHPDILKFYQEKYKYIIVDEFQDTDLIQLKILFKLAPKGNITIVGDDDQSIYRFRGAYLTNVHEFKEFYSKQGIKVESIVVDINYRCTRNIQTVATNLIRNNPDREDKKIVTEKAEGDLVAIGKYPTDLDQAFGVVNQIKELNASGIEYQDIAILVRRRIDALPIIEVMENSKIPFEIIGSREYFVQPIVKAVMSYMRFFGDPHLNSPSLGGILLRPVHGIRPGEVQALGRFAKDNDRITLWEALSRLDGYPGEKTHLVTFKAEMDRLFIVLGDKGIAEFVRAVLFSKDFFKLELARKNTDNVRLLNYFFKLTSEYLEIYPKASMDEFLFNLDALSRLGLEDDSEDAAGGKVKLMTIHGAKGKEFPIVFLPCLNEKHLPSTYKAYKIDIPPELIEGIQPTASPEVLHFQEERRLFYVACTRAKEKLFIAYFDRKVPNKGTTAVSRYLTEIIAAGEAFETQEYGELVKELDKTFDSFNLAVMDMLVSSMHRGDYQEAIDAVTAYAKSMGNPMKGIDVNHKLNQEDYRARLRLIIDEVTKVHIEKTRYSPSNLKMYDSCPLSYYYQYVLLIPGKPKTFFELGTLTHKVVETITRKIQMGQNMTEVEALKVLDSLWKSSVYDSVDMEKKDRADAEKMIKDFIAHQAGKTTKIIGLEEWMELDFDGRRVAGKIDRIDDNGETLEVIDYKSSKNQTSRPELKKDFQMALYWLGAEARYGKPVKHVGHWYLRMDKEWMVELTPEELNAIRARVKAIIENVENGKFEATPDYQACKWCDYGELCGK
ncbi:MAG: ATP-dependent DNA helicase [Thermoplasmata archaeon]|nr:ATP-dependent DNA helicase [Thermoplasmata archaeon]